MRIIARLNMGGPAIHVTNLNAQLDPIRYHSLLVTGTHGEHEGSMEDLAHDRGLRTISVPELGREIKPKDDLLTAIKLCRIIRTHRPHIVHTHTAKAGFVGRIAARLAGVPIVFHTFHGHVLKGYFGSVRTRLFIAIEKLCAKLSDCIVTLSPLLKEELVDLGVTSRDHIEVVPLGLDLGEFAQQTRYSGSFRRELGMVAEDRLIGAVGRLAKIKNIPLFLDAAARIHRKDRQVHFVLIGDGEERRNIETYVHLLGLDKVVHFAGWRRDLPKIYADLDALVISSNNEGTPVSLIEAMASGCPVVATRVGGVPDLLQNGDLGQLVPPGDASALADAITRVIRNGQETRSMAQIARENVLQRYALRRLVKDMDQLYQQTLRQKGFI